MNNSNLVPDVLGTEAPMTGGPPGPPDSLFAVINQVVLVAGIAILTLFALPRTFRFLLSGRRREGWRLYHAGDPTISPIQPSELSFKSKDLGFDIKSSQTHSVAFPRAHSTSAQENLRDSKSNVSPDGFYPIRYPARLAGRSGQGAISARWDWLGAKMSKFVGGPVKMLLGPWLVVVIINLISNVLFSIGAPPFYIAPLRPAHIAIAQIPLVFMLGTKNNILTGLLGKSYEKLNVIHQSAGRVLFVCASFHVIGQFIKYSQRGILGDIMRLPRVQAGLVAWIGLIVVVFSSFSALRKRFYDLFLCCHFIGIFTFMIAVHFHMPAVVAPYTFAGLLFYMIDLVFRAFKMRLRPATITAIDDQMSLITVHGLDNGWRAGQHVWLRILGGDRKWESHPFTVANATALHTPDAINPKGVPSRGLLLYARAAGDFTRALNADARLHSKLETNVIVDGPYGGICAGMVDAADSRIVMLIAGGSGASFAIAILEELVSQSGKGKTRTEVVDFVWVVKDHAHMAWYVPSIKQILLAADASPISLQIRLFVTKGATAPKETMTTYPSSLRSPRPTSLKSANALEILLCRPELPALVSQTISYAALAGQSGGGGGGVMIAACGPVGMTRDVQLAARRISMKDRRLAGGVTLHTEAFSM